MEPTKHAHPDELPKELRAVTSLDLPDWVHSNLDTLQAALMTNAEFVHGLTDVFFDELDRIAGDEGNAWKASATVSAFNGFTAQDLKRHREAHELYFCCKGSLSFEWRDSRRAQGMSHLRRVTIQEAEWFHVPPGFCVFVRPPVSSEDEGTDVGIALKTERSVLGPMDQERTRGKELGLRCVPPVPCPLQEECQTRGEERVEFLTKVKKGSHPLQQRVALSRDMRRRREER